VQIARTLRVALHAHVDIGIVGAFGGGTAADLDVDRILRAAIDEAMAVAHAGLPPGGVARPQHGLAAVLAQHHLAGEHVYQLVLVGMPVTLRGSCPRLQGREIDAELVEPDGIAEPLARAPQHRLAKRLGVTGVGVGLQSGDVDLWHVPIHRFRVLNHIDITPVR
jgi:hypothetical protein